MKDLLADVKAEKCAVLKRSMLELSFGGSVYYGLNEVVLQRDYGVTDTQIVKMSVQINGQDSDTIIGDGMLICTPTGSTAYSLSGRIFRNDKKRAGDASHRREANCIHQGRNGDHSKKSTVYGRFSDAGQFLFF